MGEGRDQQVGLMDIYLAHRCFGTLTRKPVSAPVQTHKLVLGQTMASKNNNTSPAGISQSGFEVDFCKL
jgi:hypothetical protein